MCPLRAPGAQDCLSEVARRWDGRLQVVLAERGEATRNAKCEDVLAGEKPLKLRCIRPVEAHHGCRIEGRQHTGFRSPASNSLAVRSCQR